MKTIYDLDLHETTTAQNGFLSITRVPGGWIYTTITVVNNSRKEINRPSSIFVPFSDEFRSQWKIIRCPTCGYPHQFEKERLKEIDRIKCQSKFCPIVFDNPDYIRIQNRSTKTLQ